jgi:hypothetical protein
MGTSLEEMFIFLGGTKELQFYRLAHAFLGHKYI